jgi:hypothetical protein
MGYHGDCDKYMGIKMITVISVVVHRTDWLSLCVVSGRHSYCCRFHTKWFMYHFSWSAWSYAAISQLLIPITDSLKHEVNWILHSFSRNGSLRSQLIVSAMLVTHVSLTCFYVITKVPLNALSWNLMQENSIKGCKHIPVFIKFRQ